VAMCRVGAVALMVCLTTTVWAQMAGTPGKADLAVASGGKSSATIVVSPAAGESEKLAAADLAKYIGLMCGAAPAIADTPQAIQAALKADAPLLLVGAEALKAKPELRSRLDKVAKPEPLLRADAIVLLREGNRVCLAGTNDESHYYAVADLLRRWGCRWFVPTDFGECIPESPSLKVGDLDAAYAPPFEIRTYWISWVGDNAGAREFKRRNMMTHGVGVPNGHALGQYVKGLGKDAFHIPISEPSTAQHVAAQLEPKFAKGDYIMLGMEDGVYQSDSPRDKELMALQWDKYFMKPAVTDAFMELYNNVARTLLAKHPDSTSKIGFLAYSNMTLPPVRKVVAEKPLVAYLAPIDIDPIHGMDDPQSPPRQEYKAMLTGWAKVMQKRLAIYDYDQGMLVWRDIPNPLVPRAIQSDIRHYRDAGILGVDTESRNAIATIFTNLYLRARLLWDPDEDPDALLAEFYPAFYGPMAKPMADYWGAILKAWDETIVTEHEYFVIPAIYTPERVATLRSKLEEAERLAKPLAAKADASRNEKLYLQRMRFTRLSFNILDAYVAMAHAAATEADYKAAAAAGDRGLAARQAMADLGGIFTTTKLEGDGYPWWPGEVRQYKELLAFTDGTKGTLLAKLPLEWAFRRDPTNVGLERKYATAPVDLADWKARSAALTLDSRKDYPDQWEMLRTDLYMQAQGIRHPDRQSFTGHAWYRTDVELAADQAKAPVHTRFPGLFNECWLYVNGVEVAHRKVNPIWWYNDYRFEWDVDLAGKLRPGANTLALRLHCPHHFGGMFRRPFLYYVAK